MKNLHLEYILKNFRLLLENLFNARESYYQENYFLVAYSNSHIESN